MTADADSIKRLRVRPSRGLGGEIHVAADKSISHRAVMLGAIACGTSRVTNLLEGEDTRATITAFRQLGTPITRTGEGAYAIDGVGLHGLKPPPTELDLGNSGTALRLMAGLLCAQPWATTLTGDESLRARPMARIIAPLREMGANISAQDGKPPLHIRPTQTLRGIRYQLPVASAQVKSCLLLAGLYAGGETAVGELLPSRDHSERMLRGFGYEVAQDCQDSSPKWVRIQSGGTLRAQDLRIPADLSSAAFFLVAGSIIADSALLLPQVGVNPSRAGVLDILKKMGADIEVRNPQTVGGEPVADLYVRSAALRGVEIGGAEVASAIDEIPIIAVAAGFAKGRTQIRGAAELRLKESDRIHATVQGLRALGVTVIEFDDGMRIENSGAEKSQSCALGDRVIQSFGDHRIAMAFAIAAAARNAADPDAAVEIADCVAIATSFPQFLEVARHAGLAIQSI